MAEQQPHFINIGEGPSRRSIAVLAEPRPAGTRRHEINGLVWLCGFKSEMTSTKATALAAHARRMGLAMTRFDYSGHGASSGRIEDGAIGDWLDETCLVVRQQTEGPVLLIGSSMGGYLALLALRKLMAEDPATAERIRASILIAPAWDMTERLMWQRFSSAAKRAVEEQGVYLRPSEYGDGAYPITRRLIEEGRGHLIGGTRFDPGRPIRIVHGLLDPDVPWEHTLDLVSELEGDWTHVTAIPDGEHRLSRPQDIDQLLSIVDDEVAVLDRNKGRLVRER